MHRFDVDQKPLHKLTHLELFWIRLLHFGPSAVKEGVDALGRRNLQVHGLAEKLDAVPSGRHQNLLFLHSRDGTRSTGGYYLVDHFCKRIEIVVY